MIREVNLLGHLPLYLQNFREMQGIMNAEEPELQLVEDTSETIKDNMFVISADEEGIKKFETMFGLKPLPNDNIYNRQAMVLSLFTNTVVHTLRGLIERLNAICGVGNYTVELIPDAYTINIGLHVHVKKLINTVTSMSADMIPANMICECVIIPNSHEVLSQYPTYFLEQFTHEELSYEWIEDYIDRSCDNLTHYTMESFESVSCENLSNFGMRKVE